jgi:hypothetical protein
MDDKQKHDVNIQVAGKDQIAENDKPLSVGSYLDLPLDDIDKQAYTDKILKRIDEIVENQDRKDIMELAKVWRSQYYGILEETSFPFAGAYNLDTKMTCKYQDAVVAQTQEAFDDADPHWTIGPVNNEEVLKVRDKQEQVLDYYDDTEMRNNEDLEAIRHDAFLLGVGWEEVVFDRNFIRVRDRKTYKTAVEFVKDFPNDAVKHKSIIDKLISGEEQELILEYNQEWRRAPKRRHVEFEDAIVPLTAKGIEGINKADVKGVRRMMKWHEINKLEREGDFEKGVSERLKYKESNRDGMVIREVDPEYLYKDFELFDVQYWINISIDGEERRVLTLWTVEKDQAVCCRAIRYPYDHMRSYLIPHCIQYTSKGLYQDGFGRKMQDIHLAANATLNHVLNASLLANSLSLKVRSQSDSARRVFEHQWYPGSVLELQNLEDVQPFIFSTPNLVSLINLFSIIEQFAQDTTGIVNYQLGTESPQDPGAPASKVYGLTKKAEKKLARYIKNLKRTEDEAGYQALRLIYQFIPTKTISGILGENVGDTKDFLQPAIRVVTNAAAFDLERMFEQRDDMMMFQMLMQDPEIAADPEKRSKLWSIVAKSKGSNWDKKLIGIMPSPEEMRQRKEEARRKQEQKKQQLIKDAATKALTEGASAEEARAVGLKAGKMAENMAERARAQAQQPVKKGK